MGLWTGGALALALPMLVRFEGKLKIRAAQKSRKKFVCKTVRPMLSVRCLSVLSCHVCNIGVLWPNGWPSSPSPKGTQPPIFCPCLLWSNGQMDEDATWYGGTGRPRPWPHCVRWGPSSPPPKEHNPHFCGPCLLWPNDHPSQMLLSTCFNFSIHSCPWNE